MRALLFDVTKCLGCGACVAACCEANALPPPDDQDLSDHQFSAVKPGAVSGQDLNIRRLCMHCLDPTCASVCPVGALRKLPSGPVVYDPDICMGCRYCLQACPFDVPRYEWNSLAPRIRKCDFCARRVAAGKPNACAEACPTGATVCGERDELLVRARNCLAREPDKYVQEIYGDQEVGGTCVLVLSSVPFGELGLPEKLPQAPLPLLTHAVLSKVPAVVGAGGMLLAGLWWFTRRKAEVARFELDSPRKGGSR